jgi:hypothetical protein
MRGGLYARFPGRRIVDSPFKKKVIVHYGIVAFAADTRRWLILRPKFTLNFIYILQGRYRLSDLRELVTGLTQKEFQVLQTAAKDILVLEKLLQETFPAMSVEDRIYAKERFLTAINTFGSWKEEDLSLKFEPAWIFPQGPTQSKTEHPIDCALRQFTAQTQMTLSETEISFFGQEPILSLGDDLRQRYETRCWVCIFLQEPALPPVPASSLTVGECQWAGEEEARSLLVSRDKMLSQAKQIITRHFSF